MGLLYQVRAYDRGMSLLVLSDRDVHKLLDMESCIEAMADVLAALQRDELSMPLRFIFRPEGATSLMGFMPAHRAGASPLFSLKEIVDLARELGAGHGSAPGSRDAPRRRDRRAAGAAERLGGD